MDERIIKRKISYKESEIEMWQQKISTYLHYRNEIFPRDYYVCSGCGHEWRSRGKKGKLYKCVSCRSSNITNVSLNERLANRKKLTDKIAVLRKEIRELKKELKKIEAQNKKDEARYKRELAKKEKIRIKNYNKYKDNPIKRLRYVKLTTTQERALIFIAYFVIGLLVIYLA